MKLRPLIVAGLLLLTFSRVALAGPSEKMSGLLTNSPFGSAKAGVINSNANGEPFELRAVLEGKVFSIYETATRRSIWVELNDPVDGFSVKSYDAAKENIAVDYQGKIITLAIKRAPAVAQAIQQPVAVPGSNGMVMPGSNAPVPGAPTSVDQQRMQQIQEEIRRRRALRSQPPGTVPGNGAQAQPNYGSGPQPTPSTSGGPVPQPSNSPGPQPIPAKQ